MRHREKKLGFGIETCSVNVVEMSFLCVTALSFFLQFCSFSFIPLCLCQGYPNTRSFNRHRVDISKSQYCYWRKIKVLRLKYLYQKCIGGAAGVIFIT